MIQRVNNCPIGLALDYIKFIFPNVAYLTLNRFEGWDFKDCGFQSVDFKDEVINTNMLKNALDYFYNHYNCNEMTFI